MNLEFLENVCQFLPSLRWCTDKRAEADEMLTAALPLNTLAQPDAAIKHTHTAHTVYAHYTRERKQICLCLVTNSHSPAQTVACSITSCTLRPKNTTRFWQTHRFLILLFGASGFLGFLNDSIESEAQAAHARQVGHIYVKLQLLIPQWLRAHCHLRACHHLTEQFAAMEQTSLHHKLEGKHTYTVVIRWRHDMWSGSWRGLALVWGRLFVEDLQTSQDDSEFPVSLRLWVTGSTHS